jgi:dihydroorotase
MSEQLRLALPDDWHLHLRDGAAMRSVLPHSAARFGRAIVMPNLVPPITSVALATAYRERIMAAVPHGSSFTPLMTLYLTDDLSPAEIDRAVDSGIVYGAKLYPAGATTHSHAGVTDVARIDKVLERMAARDLPLLVHGEVTDPAVDIFDREAVFIERVLAPLLQRHAGLRVVMEHVSTRAAVQFVAAGGARLAATVTPQHLMFNRNALLVGGIRPHYYCLPILKTEPDRQALLAIVASGHPRFFLGTDSAPHARHAKESACGCAGVYSAYAALELYAGIFEEHGMLARLEAFAAHFGADFYRLPRNAGSITLERQPWQPPAHFAFGDEQLVPLNSGAKLAWKLVA